MIRCEKDRCPCNILGIADTTKGIDHLDHVGKFQFSVFGQSVDMGARLGSIHRPGRDRVDPYALWPHLTGQGFRKGIDGPFGQRVGR